MVLDKKIIYCMVLSLVLWSGYGCNTNSSKTESGKAHTEDVHSEGEEHADETHEGEEHEGEAHVDEGHEGEEHEGEAHADKAHEGGEHESEEAGEHAGHSAHAEEGVVELTPEAIAMAGIQVVKAGNGRIHRTIDIPGEVGFNEDKKVHITPRFAGIAREVKCRVGDYVNAGDIVATVESNESMNTYAIKTPISGMVIEKHVTVGEFVSNEESMYLIVDLSNVWVNLAVYPADAAIVKAGLRVTIRAVGTDAATDGTIQYVTPVLDASTRSMTARVVLPNSGNRWKPGTFVHAKVMVETGEEGLVVEKAAVQVLHEKNVVFVSEEHGFKPVEIRIGKSDEQFVRVLSGLELGTEYVAAGAFELKAKIVTSSLGAHAGHNH